MGRFTIYLLLFLTFLVSACGGGSSNNAGSGTLSIGLTDTPVADAEKVVIHFTRVQVHGGDGTTTDIEVIDPVTKLPGRSIDLMQLQGDKSTVLFDKELPAGNYSWMRLELDLNKSYIVTSTGTHQMLCTSCQNSGYKLNRSFKVDKDAVMAYMVDFDLHKSITLSNNGYHLRPTLRVVETAAAGHLSGDVDATLMTSLGGETGCKVYVYDGHDITPNDIYLPVDIVVPTGHYNPLATANVDATTHQYTVGYLAAGDYTVALTCDGEHDDISEKDADVVFHGAANITVVAGQMTTHPFVP